MFSGSIIKTERRTWKKPNGILTDWRRCYIPMKAVIVQVPFNISEKNMNVLKQDIKQQLREGLLVLPGSYKVLVVDVDKAICNGSEDEI
jgi:hypothetical protein